MGSRARARRAAAMLGFLGLLCAVLGAVMIVMVPTLIKQQVLKVGEGRRPGPAPGRGLEGAQPEARRAAAGIGALVPGPPSTAEPRAHRQGQLAASPVPSATQAEVGGKGGFQGLSWRRGPGSGRPE